MKVLHLSSERTWRGGEQQIAYLLLELRKLQVECHVAARKGSVLAAWAQEQGFKTYAVGFRNEFDLKTALRLKKICKEHKIDIIHAHSSHSHAMALWSKILGNQARFVLHRRVDFPIRNNWLSRFKFNHGSIERIICISHAIQEVMQKDLKNPEKCITVHSGIDLSRFEGDWPGNRLKQEYSLPAEEKIVANFSAVADHKDYFTFVDTAELVCQKKSGVTFFIVGDGPMREEINQYILEKGMEHKVVMTGFRKDIPMLFRSIDLFLITSKTEGLGTTILDAFANRIPVVGTKAGGIPEAIEHEKTGLITDVGDSDKLASLVTDLLQDSEKRSHLAENAFQKLVEKFTSTAMASGVFRAYQDLDKNK